MKRLLILALIYLNVQIAYGMDHAQFATLDPEQLKTLTPTEYKMLAAQQEQVQVGSYNISLLPKIEHLTIDQKSIAMGKNHVALARGRSVVVHDLKGNVIFSELLGDRHGTIVAHTISDDGRFFAFVDSNGDVVVIDVDHQEENRRVAKVELQNARQITFDHQTKNLAVIGLKQTATDYRVYLALLDEKLELINYEEKPITNIPKERERESKAQICLSLDGEHMAVVTPDGLLLWNLKKKSWKKKANENNLTHIAVIACDDNGFAVLSISTEKGLDGNFLHKLIVAVYTHGGKLDRKFDGVEFDDSQSADLNIWSAQLVATPDGLRIWLLGEKTYKMIDVENCKFLQEWEGRYSPLCCMGPTALIKYRLKDPDMAMVYGTAKQLQARKDPQQRITAAIKNAENIVQNALRDTKREDATKEAQRQAEAKAAADAESAAKLSALRKKRIITACICVAGIIAVYTAWATFKKKTKKKPATLHTRGLWRPFSMIS